MKTKTKHLYKRGCFSPSKPGWALHEIPSIKLVKDHRIPYVERSH